MQKIIDNIDEGIRLGKEAARLYSESNELLSAAVELVAVASWRGDDELSHPSDDPKLWSARMQTAWHRLHASVERNAPGVIENEHDSMREWEKRSEA